MPRFHARCDPAPQQCSIFPGVVTLLQWALPDPAQSRGTQEERLTVFRQVRDDIANRVRQFIDDDAV
jgi:arsenate reductase (thioredoxin)